VDLNDIDNPVKRKFDEDVYVKTQLEKYNYIDVYLSKTEYTLYDNPLWASEISKQGVYYDVERVSNSYGDLSDRWFGRLSVKMSNKVNQMERHVYTFFDLIGTIGGFYGLFDIFLGIILGYLGAKMYKHSLLNSIPIQKVTLCLKLTFREMTQYQTVIFHKFLQISF
jgi:hypothetical protein